MDIFETLKQSPLFRSANAFLFNPESPPNPPPNLPPDSETSSTQGLPSQHQPISHTQLPNVWVYAGDAYDLSEFVTQHPGGEFFIGRMKNRDITTLVNVLHANPSRAKKRLKKYALNRKAVPTDLHPHYRVPPFIFKRGFDAERDTPHFNFNRDSQLLDTIRERLKTPEMKAKIARADTIFDIVTAFLICAYFGLQLLSLGHETCLPAPLFVLSMVVIRIALAGSGHYFNHRAMVGWNKLFCYLFDLNYVPIALVNVDGHTLMHHPYTQSDVDVKRNVFTAMMDLPRYYRVPLHTVHKVAHVLTGMLVRTLEICTLSVQFDFEIFYGTWQRGIVHHLGMVVTRLLLLGELILFWQQGAIGVWLAQFVLTVWISTFMIVASHNFEVDGVAEHPTEEDDWAIFQVENSYDLTMIGNRYIDCFLSAGLSPHRVHHVLPYQRSGFANIVSEAIVREESEKVGVEWLPPRNFFANRLPSMVRHYLFSPSRAARERQLSMFQEHFSPGALKESLGYVYKGFLGFGSV